ncbi:MAG: creatininase family protein [Paracoccaceae bacterium]
MRLINSTWLEIEDYLTKSDGIIVPTGSIEQHGPMGLIGTDTICVDEIALSVGKRINCLITPPMWFTPAEFNMGFPGTLSVPKKLFESLCAEVFKSLERHGFRHIYVLNGHGANLEPLKKATSYVELANIRVKSWWDFRGVNKLRKKYFDDWEGMHATPSEIAITQVNNRVVKSSLAEKPPEKISLDFIKAHAGDKHGSATEHRNAFPDGRVGSHSALANRDKGIELLKSASHSVEKDYLDFLNTIS